MRKVNFFLMVALSAGLMAAARPVLEVVSPAHVAEARAAGDESGGSKWEYCAVTKAQYAASIRGGVFWIVYFRGGGVQTVDVETGPGGNAQGRAIAKLGEEGWELVGEGVLDARQTGRDAPTGLLFKRLKK